MSEISDAMLLYGESVAKQTRAEQKVKTLRAEKKKEREHTALLLNRIDELTAENEALREDNARLQTWTNNLLSSILQFCNTHQIQMMLPSQPPLQVTNNFNERIENFGSLNGDVTTPKEAPKKKQKTKTPKTKITPLRKCNNETRKQQADNQ